jgi:hypothetical protein
LTLALDALLSSEAVIVASRVFGDTSLKLAFPLGLWLAMKATNCRDSCQLSVVGRWKSACSFTHAVFDICLGLWAALSAPLRVAANLFFCAQAVVCVSRERRADRRP